MDRVGSTNKFIALLGKLHIVTPGQPSVRSRPDDGASPTSGKGNACCEGATARRSAVTKMRKQHEPLVVNVAYKIRKNNANSDKRKCDTPVPNQGRLDGHRGQDVDHGPPP